MAWTCLHGWRPNIPHREGESHVRSKLQSTCSLELEERTIDRALPFKGSTPNTFSPSDDRVSLSWNYPEMNPWAGSIDRVRTRRLFDRRSTYAYNIHLLLRPAKAGDVVVRRQRPAQLAGWLMAGSETSKRMKHACLHGMHGAFILYYCSVVASMGRRYKLARDTCKEEEEKLY